jgi:IrrE N-terminal-like domain
MTSLQGLALDGRLVVVASWITSLTQRRWVLAHELGHVLVQRGALPHCSESEEWTADWFARELLAPNSHLAALPDLAPEAAAEHFDVDVAHIVLQRLRLAGATEPVIYDGQVLCPDCGHCQFLPRCSCGTLRRDLGRKRATQPSGHAWEPPTETGHSLRGEQRVALTL